MRICASCGETYPEEVELCDLDGTPLCTWEEATRVVLGPADDVAIAVRAPDEEESTSERPTVPRLQTGSIAAARAPAATVLLEDHVVGDDAMHSGLEGSIAKLTGRVRFSDVGLAPAFEPGDAEDTGVEDTGVEDTGVEDTGIEDTAIARLANSARVHDGIVRGHGEETGVDELAVEETTRFDQRGLDEETDVSGRSGSFEPGPRAGRLLGRRYRLRHRMAVGGFGAVFAAEDVRLQKAVAVKVLSPHVAASAEHLERFQREAIAAGHIGHEGIVNVTDFDRDDDGTHFIVMELLEGQDLSQLIAAQGALPLESALSLAKQVATALDCAHRRGILHRDLKPANVFVTRRGDRDVVKVLDFGISKVMHRRLGRMSLTQTGQVVGTPYYMAPEQAQGRVDIDGRVDVYALGVMMYEMLVGTPPFTGNHYVTVALLHLTAAPPTPSAVRPDLPRSVDRLVLRAMAKEPADRFPSMAAFDEAIGGELEALRDQAAPAATAAAGSAPIEVMVESEIDDSITMERGSPRRARSSSLGFVAGQVARTPPTRQRRRRRTLAFGIAGALAMGTIATVASDLGRGDDRADRALGTRALDGLPRWPDGGAAGSPAAGKLDGAPETAERGREGRGEATGPAAESWPPAAMPASGDAGVP